MKLREQQARIQQRLGADQTVLMHLRAFSRLRGEGKFAPGGETDYLQRIFDIHRLMHALAHADAPLLARAWRGRTLGLSGAKTPLDSWLLSSMRFHLGGIVEAYSCHQISLYFELFADHLARFDGRSMHLQAWAEILQRALRAPEFRRFYARHRRTVIKTSRGLLGYMHELCRRYRDLLVVRVNLGFALGTAEAHGSVSRVDVLEQQGEEPEDLQAALKRQQGVELDNLKAALKRQLAHMRKTFKHRVGHAWCVEYDLRRGFHVHFLLFFDGEEESRDVTLAKAFGDHWTKVSTDGKGTFWNLNAERDRFAQAGVHGVGLIHCRQAMERRRLVQAVLCLTKADSYVQLRVPSLGRTFGRGSLADDTPKPTPAPKRARVSRRSPGQAPPRTKVRRAPPDRGR